MDVILKELEERILVKVTGNVYPDKESEWIPFVGRERQCLGNKIHRRVRDKFVVRAAELLGLESAKTMATPTTKELYHKEGTEKLSDEQRFLVRQVVGMLHYVQADYKLMQFTLRGIASEVEGATDMTLTRLRHLVRYLMGCKDEVAVLEPDSAAAWIEAWADSDWAGDRSSRKSVDCIVVKVYGSSST